MHNILFLLVLQNYSLALEVLEQVMLKSTDLSFHHKRSLLSAIGRLHLQLGDVVGAEQYFTSARNVRQHAA